MLYGIAAAASQERLCKALASEENCAAVEAASTHKQMRLPAALLLIAQATSDVPLELVARLRAARRDGALLESHALTMKEDAFADVPLNELEQARASLGEDFVRGFHGTTTVAFRYAGGTVCCVDSRASLGTFVGSSAEKIIPLSRTTLGTRAGSAADCVSWLRILSALSKLHELETGDPLTAGQAARTLGRLLRQRRGEDHGVGTMVFDSDALYYVDGEGCELKGSSFAVGSGSVYAYPALEAGLMDGLVDADAALKIAERAVATAAVRDAYSGGVLNLCVAEKGARGWRRLLRQPSPTSLS